MSIQSTIEATTASLSPSLQRIAAIVRERPQIVLESTINQLAEACETSVASVVRFCQAIGLTGYAQLRVTLATELGKQAAQFGPSDQGAEISPTDTLEQAARKITTLELMAIDETLGTLDFAVMETIIDHVESASRIILYGIGASQFVADDLQHKLFRIGREAFSFRDPHEAWSAAALPIGGVVALGISHSGETHETLKFLQIAADNGAYTVGLTGVPGSSLAKLADATLLTKVRESTFRAGAMVSRIAQLALIDCLFTGIAQRRYRFTVDALRRTREVTRGT
ncbi:MurR/RpiR family transcriptional regulator [Microbacterium kribbense]|uniref:MurR/RpiR family transcriptional regulator n=1 Tax=Microbacterium kribbense TaxID=433645 RepID=A0ABP7GG74_9MICO